MRVIWWALSWVLLLYLGLLFVRMILSWIPLVSRDWRPRGIMLFVAEITFTLTDPPLKAVRKVVPSIRVGTVALDLSFMIVFFACSFLLQLTTVMSQ